MPSPEWLAEQFEQHRAHLRAVAYRMLGSASEADDAVQGPPAAIEIGFLLADVPAAYQRAIDAGCTSVAPPEKRPWGPTVAFVRDDEGVLVELCSKR
jgi:uncharacterized glyoxalase superfamily protein PhnB